MITTSNEQEEDKTLDTPLRPQRLCDYVGQQKIRKNLQMFMDAAKKRKASAIAGLGGVPNGGRTDMNAPHVIGIARSVAGDRRPMHLELVA